MSFEVDAFRSEEETKLNELKLTSNPSVMSKATFSPVRSRRQFVATVVESLVYSILETSSFFPRGCLLPVAISRTRRIPSTGASP